jgi:hypothetical protein
MLKGHQMNESEQDRSNETIDATLNAADTVTDEVLLRAGSEMAGPGGVSVYRTFLPGGGCAGSC